MENEVITGRSKRVNINDALSVIVEPFARLYSQECMAIWNGEEVKLDKVIHEAGLLNDDTLLLIGIPSLSELSGRVRYFNRFREFRAGDYWNVGVDRWDGIAFKPKKNIKVLGVGLYETYNSAGAFSIGWKYIIEDESGATIVQSPTYVEVTDLSGGVHNHVIKHKFTSVKPIPVKANQKITMLVYCIASQCFYAESGGDY